MSNSNTCNHLIVRKQMIKYNYSCLIEILKTDCVKKKTPGTFKHVMNKICLKIINLVYMYKGNLALNGWYAIKPNPTKSNIFDIFEENRKIE